MDDERFERGKKVAKELQRRASGSPGVKRSQTTIAQDKDFLYFIDRATYGDRREGPNDRRQDS